MTKEEKQKVFSLMLKSFETEIFKEYFNDMVAEIPDYIFTMPSSTSGKYHNKTQCQKFGQVYHVYMFFSILEHRLRLKHNKEIYSKPEIRDAMRCVPVFHDAIKCGLNGSTFTVPEHPILAGEWVRKTKVEHDIPEIYKEMIIGMCEAHSGEWNKNRSKIEIMPEPRNDMEFFIHECDILSSRNDIDMIIPDDLKAILEGNASAPEIDIDTYIITFGKYRGRTLKQVNQIDRQYILWAKENMTKEPVATLLKQL